MRSRAFSACLEKLLKLIKSWVLKKLEVKVVLGSLALVELESSIRTLSTIA